MRSFDLRSPGTFQGEPMPSRFFHEKAGGQNVSPSLHFGDLPEGTRSIAFMFVDRSAEDFVHWVVVDLPGREFLLEEGASREGMPAAARQLYNSDDFRGYSGPNPVPRSGPHKHEVVAYALDTPTLEVEEHVDARSFERAATEHALAVGSTYWMCEKSRY